METTKPLIDQLVKIIQQGQDIIGGQLPDVAKQLLAYNAWSCHLWMLIFGCLFLMVVLLSVFTLEDGMFVGFMIALFFLFCAYYEYDQLHKIQLAPKLFIIETLKNIAK